MSSARRPGSSSRPPGGSSRKKTSGSVTSSRPSGSVTSSRPSGSVTSSRIASSRSSERSTSRSSSGSSRDRDGSLNTSTKLAPQEGLMEIVQKRFVNDVFESAAKAYPGWKVLIVDEPGMKVISAAVGMYDIMERQISIVESLDKKRAPFKDMAAIYILAPTKDSIRKLLDDYADKTKVLYGKAVFVFFLGTIPSNLVAEIKQCKQLLKRLKALSEINVDFLVREQRAFTLDMNEPFGSFYLRNGMSPVETILAEKLVTLCATLNEYPYIRYKQTSGICSSLASIFKLKMDEFVSNNTTWWYHGSGKCPNRNAERERSTFLLLDRSSDCMTPLMHDFTYQSMVHDLLEIEGDQITYMAEKADNPMQKEKKDVLLNEKDKLWVELRGNHIAAVIETLSGRINEVVNSSTSSAVHKQSGSNMSLSQLASALKELPEYREVMSKLSQHMHIAHDCMDKFNRDGLLDLADVEQTLATGKDEDGRSPKLTETISRCESALIRLREPKDRLRLLLIATISQNGLTSSDRDRLLRAAQLGREELQTLDALSRIGINTINNAMSTPTGSNSFFGSVKSKLSSSDSFDEESEYASSRYAPPLKSILTDLVANQLSTQEYPSVIPMPMLASSSSGAGSARRRGKGGSEGSARKKGGATDKWSKMGGSVTKSTTNGSNYAGGRNIVFMVGGLSYSELRVVRDVMEKESREIIAGSTKFVSPTEFCDDLHTLVN